jgi:hydroxymethylglutaryl-CoA lyase
VNGMKRIIVQEVGMRDGLQNENQYIPTDQKIKLINQLSESGLEKIEVTSFVSPKAIPNLRDAEEVMNGIKRKSGVTYSALVPNLKGAKRAVDCNVDEINLVASVSTTHNQKNVRRTTKQSFDNFGEMMRFLSGVDIRVNGTLGTAFGCPYEGDIAEERVLQLIEQYLELGIDGITLADTTGMAAPKQVYELSVRVLDNWPDLPLTLHFHNTRGMGLANVIEGIRAGAKRFDASLGGIGGCPFAPGATGNICTEDLIHMLVFMGYELSADLDKVIDSAKYLQDLLSYEVPGQILKAGKRNDLHPISH